MGWVVNAMPRPFYPRERPSTHCTRGWVGPRAGLDGCGKYPPPTGIQSADRSPRSQSIYRLSYPGPPSLPVRITKYRRNQTYNLFEPCVIEWTNILKNTEK